MILFTNTLKTLQVWGEKIRQTYRENNIQAGYDPSQPLQNEVTFNVNVSGSNFEIVFNLPSYWKFAENGRGPGKMPPPGVLLEWMKFKHILPHPVTLSNGKNVLPSMESLEYVIRRKIGRDGTKGQHTWEATVNQLKEGLTKAVEDALYRDIAEYVKRQSK